MRRLAAAALALAAIAVAVATIGATGTRSGMYRVDALFDNADYLVPGQEVKIAGAIEGDVSGLHVTPQHKALVEMEVQQAFAPFRSDASCEIRPESLIGEKFVQCDPGSPNGAPLAGRGGRPPTVPLASDHSPVDLDLVLSALRLPYRERLALLVDELGTGVAGRPADLNAAVRRSAPALDEAHKVLAILNSDRETLGRLIDASDSALAQLAAHRNDVANFISHAAGVTAALAGRQSDLGASIHRLPPLLAQLEPASVELAGFANDARPVARDLHAAAGPVNRLLGDLAPLTAAAHPTLVKLDELSVTGLRTVRHTMPVARKLLPVARELPPGASLTRALTESLRAKGMIEGLLQFVYFTAESESRFDVTSHILPSFQIFNNCNQYATQPVAGCIANWGGRAQGQVSAFSTRHGGHESPHSARQTAPPAAASHVAQPQPQPSPAPPAAPAPQPGSATPPAPQPPTVIRQVLGYLLGP